MTDPPFGRPRGQRSRRFGNAGLDTFDVIGMDQREQRICTACGDLRRDAEDVDELRTRVGQSRLSVRGDLERIDDARHGVGDALKLLPQCHTIPESRLGSLALGDAAQKRNEGMRVGVIGRADFNVDDGAVAASVTGFEQLTAFPDDRAATIDDSATGMVDVEVDDPHRQQLLAAIAAHPLRCLIHIEQLAGRRIDQPEAIARRAEHFFVTRHGLLQLPLRGSPLGLELPERTVRLGKPAQNSVGSDVPD